MTSVPLPLFTRAGRAVAACALAGSIAVGLAACGSSGSSANAAGATSTSARSSSRYQARLKAAECLRAHGVNVPDPTAGGGAPGGGGADGGGRGGVGLKLRQVLATPAGQAASKACAADIRGAFAFANITPAQRAQFQQDAVKFAECMRAHNVNIPDPTSNGAGGFGIFRSISPSERNSPAFQTAFNACSSNLPNRGRFGRDRPGATGPGSVGGPGA